VEQKMDLNRPGMDYRGPDWAALREWLQTELDHTLASMLAPDITEAKTQQLRGRALAFKQMLSFPEADAAFRPRT
jgi:hypothetical protein